MSDRQRRFYRGIRVRDRPSLDGTWWLDWVSILAEPCFVRVMFFAEQIRRTEDRGQERRTEDRRQRKMDRRRRNEDRGKSTRDRIQRTEVYDIRNLNEFGAHIVNGTFDFSKCLASSKTLRCANAYMHGWMMEEISRRSFICNKVSEWSQWPCWKATSSLCFVLVLYCDILYVVLYAER